MSKLWGVLLVVALVAAPGRAGVFADVPFDHWAHPAIDELAELGLVPGYPEKEYRGLLSWYDLAVCAERAYGAAMKREPGTVPPAAQTHLLRLIHESADLLQVMRYEPARMFRNAARRHGNPMQLRPPLTEGAIAERRQRLRDDLLHWRRARKRGV